MRLLAFWPLVGYVGCIAGAVVVEQLSFYSWRCLRGAVWYGAVGVSAMFSVGLVAVVLELSLLLLELSTYGAMCFVGVKSGVVGIGGVVMSEVTLSLL